MFFHSDHGLLSILSYEVVKERCCHINENFLLIILFISLQIQLQIADKYKNLSREAKSHEEKNLFNVKTFYTNFNF